MAEQKGEPWVQPLLECVTKNTENFPEAEKQYFRALVQYEVDHNNKSEAQALAVVVSEIANAKDADISKVSRFIASAFQRAGREVVCKLTKSIPQ